MSNPLASDATEIPGLDMSNTSPARSPEEFDSVRTPEVEEQGNSVIAEARAEAVPKSEEIESDLLDNQVKEEEDEETALSAQGKPEVYTSLLSEFDDFVANEKNESLAGASRALSYGFQIGDMVWGKVKSHPWWPGQIFDEDLASSSVRRTRREGHVLVAFFGDSSYGWFDPAELIPFDDNFLEKAQQTNTRNFTKAVEEAVDEASRRSALGLLCKCSNPSNFKRISVDGYFSVDVPEFEPNGIYSTNQITKLREGFAPSLLLRFVKLLAVVANDIDVNRMEIVKCKSEAVAFRKAVFEEVDETCSQASGTSPKASACPSDHRAPLSGPLVIAEALGGGKNSKKSAKTKESHKKDKYVLKKRDDSADEPINQKELDTLPEIVYPSAEEDFVLQKRVPDLRVPKDDDSIVVETGTPDTTVVELLPVQPDIVEEKEQTGAVSSTKEQDDRDASEKSVVKKVKRNQTGADGPVGGEKKAKKSPDTASDLGNEDVQVSNLLKDLRFVAFESSDEEPRRMSSFALQFFLRFRSAVYQKSLTFSANELIKSEVIKSPPTQPVGVKKPVRLKDAEAPKPEKFPEIDRKRVQPDRPEEIPAKRIKKPNAEAKKSVSKPDPQKTEVKEAKKLENPTKSSDPTMIVMRFPPQTSLPSGAELKAKFARFGAIDVSQIRVFWKSSTCRVVFRHKRDAESAYRYALGNPTFFGKMEVRYSLRDVGEASDAGRVGRDDASNEGVLGSPAVPPKSILKKATGEEGGHVAGGNGGKGARVKFALGGEETSGSVVGSDLNKNNLVKGPVPLAPSHLPPLLPLPKFGKVEINNSRSSQNPNSQNVTDISQQMLSLLAKCSDVVSTLTNVYGFVPYRPL